MIVIPRILRATKYSFRAHRLPDIGTLNRNRKNTPDYAAPELVRIQTRSYRQPDKADNTSNNDEKPAPMHPGVIGIVFEHVLSTHFRYLWFFSVISSS